MDDYALAALFGWEDVRALSGWVGIISFVLVLAGTEYMRRTFATKTDLERECRERRVALEQETRDRKKADEHQDERMHHLAEVTQQYIGKIDLLRDRMEKQDRAREREVTDLREEVRTGFARIEGKIDRLNNRGES